MYKAQRLPVGDQASSALSNLPQQCSVAVLSRDCKDDHRADRKS